MRIEDEIRQKKFKSEYQKAHINILFTAAWLNQQNQQILKPLGISSQQFNILRILRGMHPQPVVLKPEAPSLPGEMLVTFLLALEGA